MSLAQRLEARARRRRVIFNNDGGDCFLNDGRMNAESLLEARTSALAGSHVDTLFYCTVKTAFGFFIHTTRVGEVWTNRTGRYANNLMPALLEQGTDPLQIMVDWSRAHGQEVFWSLRMNDTHDGWGHENTDRPLAPLKREHPDWLLSTPEHPPRFGKWSALNYGLPAVREWIFRLIEEAAERYDLDGIECDFLRHETFFPATAAGEVCGDEERAAMTDLMRHVRTALDRIGHARGKPILLAVRVPDSVALCRDLGLDIEAWMAEGWIDLMTVTCYYRLNPWQTSVELGHRYHVPVYAGLSESRVIQPDGTREPLRQSIEAYRGRALDAWEAGIDGIYIFNLFQPDLPIWREAGDPLRLSRLNRIHFPSVRSMGQSNKRFPNHYRYRTVPLLAPDRAKGYTISLRHDVIEIPVGGGNASGARAVELRLRIGGLTQAEQVAVRWNNAWLSTGSLYGNVLHLPLPPDSVCPFNSVGVVLAAPVQALPVLEDLQVWVAAESSLEEMERKLQAGTPY